MILNWKRNWSASIKKHAITAWHSAETQRELIVSFNNKKFLTKFWKTAEEMLLSVKKAVAEYMKGYLG